MQVVVGDALGSLHVVNCHTKQIRRLGHNNERTFQKAVTCMEWSGLDNERETELTLGRADGYIEAVDLKQSEPVYTPVRSIRLPSSITHLSVIHPNPSAEIAQIKEYLGRLWLSSTTSDNQDLFAQYCLRFKSVSESLTIPDGFSLLDTPENKSESSAYGSIQRRLLCISKSGHACILPWENTFHGAEAFQSLSSETDYKVVAATVGKRKEPSAAPAAAIASHGSPAAHPSADSLSDCAFYKLPAPISCAATHPTASHFTAFGGKENDVKVFDCHSGSLFWSARNVKRNYLDLRVPVDVTALGWLVPIHPDVLAATTYCGKLRIYDIRAQRRPVFETSVSHEGRCITSLCIPKTAGKQMGGGDKAPPVNSLQLCSKSPIGNTHRDRWIRDSQKAHPIGSCPIYMGDTHGMLYKCRFMSTQEVKWKEGGGKAAANLTDAQEWVQKSCLSKHHCIQEGVFRNQMGATTAMDVRRDDQYLVSVGLGRFASIYNTETRRLMVKIYLKQKLTSCLFFSPPARVADEKPAVKKPKIHSSKLQKTL